MVFLGSFERLYLLSRTQGKMNITWDQILTTKLKHPASEASWRGVCTPVLRSLAGGVIDLGMPTGHE